MSRKKSGYENYNYSNPAFKTGAHHTLPYSSREYIKIAKDLRYSDEIIEALKQAKSHNEASRIMMRGRREKITW